MKRKPDPLAEKQKISIALSWDDYQNKINVWVASTQLPDVFAIDAIGTRNFYTWINNNIIKPLPDNLDSYPNVAKIMTYPNVSQTKANGKFYAFPRTTYNVTPVINGLIRIAFYRKDWAQQLELMEPNTFDEFVAFAKADFNSWVKDSDGKESRDFSPRSIWKP